MSRKLRFVFDTSVVVSALLFERSLPGQSFYAALDQGTVLVSTETFAELSTVLARPKFDRYLTRDQREQFLAMLLREACLVQTTEQIRACRDANDDKFLELALSGPSACLISGDNDLLVLHPFRGIPILSPADFLAWLALQPNQ